MNANQERKFRSWMVDENGVEVQSERDRRVDDPLRSPERTSNVEALERMQRLQQEGKLELVRYEIDYHGRKPAREVSRTYYKRGGENDA